MGINNEWTCKTISTPPPPPEGVKQEFDEQGRGYWNCPGMNNEEGGSSADYHPAHPHEYRIQSTKAEANLVSSLCEDGKHRPVIDFDVPCRYVPSSTPGHGHLYIDVAMDWEKYAKLLIALRDAGVVEEGYLNAALERGATFVRPTWVKNPGHEAEAAKDPDGFNGTLASLHSGGMGPL